jgi:hypothetical protein
LSILIISKAGYLRKGRKKYSRVQKPRTGVEPVPNNNLELQAVGL